METGVKRDDPGCRALPEALVNPLSDNALIKTIPLEHFPRDLFMIGRSLMILRGLTHSLGMDVKVGSRLSGITCKQCRPVYTSKHR